MIALDLGGKRVGIAKSDELGLMAHALPFIDAQPAESFLDRLAKVIEGTRASRVIVGHPIAMTGGSGLAAQKFERQVELFRERFPRIAFELRDERLTTKSAQVYLRTSGQSQTKRRQKVDSLSAQIQLQDYLDLKRRS